MSDPGEAKRGVGASNARAAGTAIERRYYKIEVDFALASRSPPYIWLNEDEIKERFRPERGQPFYGLQFSEPPRIAFDRRKSRGRPRDCYPVTLGIWLATDRLKELLERLDPDAFAFMQAEVDYSNFNAPGPGFWFCDFVRTLDCIDDERSEVEYHNDEGPSPKRYAALIDVRMRPDVVGSAHAFRLTRANLKEIVDDVLVDAIKREKIRGFRFVDIQRP